MAPLSKLALALTCCSVLAGCGTSNHTPGDNSIPKNGATSTDGKARSAASNDIWQDERGRYWSNERIPFLHDMPKSVEAKMPDQQRKLINKIEELITKTTKDVKAVKNSFGREQIESRLQQEQHEFSAQYNRDLRGKITGWVGRVQVHGGRKVSLSFGNTSNWLTHGNKYPYAKDKDCAFVSEEFYDLSFSLKMLEEDVQKVLLTLEHGDWVRVDGVIFPEFKESEVRLSTRSLYFECWTQVFATQDSADVRMTTVDWEGPNGQCALKLAKIEKLASGM
jgi:hypothetical protein